MRVGKLQNHDVDENKLLIIFGCFFFALAASDLMGTRMGSLEHDSAASNKHITPSTQHVILRCGCLEGCILPLPCWDMFVHN